MENKNTNKNKFIVYVRKSSESDERQALSIDSQKNEMEKLIKRNELKPSQIIRPILEESFSAKLANKRIVFIQMIKQLEEEKIDGIICWSPDRLSRNAVDTGILIDLMDRHKLKWIITSGQRFDGENPNDKFLFSILCSQAKLENDNRGKNAKRGMLTKAEMGWYPAQAPLGYLNVTTEKSYKTIKNDPVRLPIIEKCFNSLVDGIKPFEVLEKAQNEWKLTNNKGNIISRSGFYNMISNSFYYGEYEWPKKSGNWYEGKHEPIVSKNNFKTVQKMLGNKGSPVRKSVNYKYSGLMRCAECGYSFSGDYKEKYYPKTNRVGEYFYYRCTKKSKNHDCHQKPISEGNFEKQMKDMLSSIRPPQGFLDWAKKWIAELHKDNANFHQGVRRSLHSKKERIEKRLDSFIDMLADGDITSEKYNEKKKKLEEELRDINSIIKTNDKGSSDWRVEVENALDFADTARERFNSDDPEVKRYLINHLGENLVCNHKKIRMDIEKHFFEFTEQENWGEKYKDWREPQKYTEIMGKNPDLRPSNPLWLPRVDSNHEPTA